ncbi:hypothetical protein [Emticicia sp. C21]|uniref:hypothetical protein n=1 Tax=Emticicia sp. C21 TaxID=2302915 RepID=UPI000E35186B|nr:hypothetical protein [Emticicia sp. C21]RFS15501.1 hypothetical protein D0T08_15225 [Emticicia sp. C21]
MIKTAIILSLDGNFPIWHKNDGFAKSEKDAKWIFEFCGWKTAQSYPELAICIEEIEANELDEILLCRTNQIWVLGGALMMN